MQVQKLSIPSTTDPQEIPTKSFLHFFECFGAPRSSEKLVQKSHISKSNWNLEMLVFEERGKPEYPKKNLSEQSRKPTTNSTHIRRHVRESNPAHISGRRALSPLCHPCPPPPPQKVKNDHRSKVFNLRRLKRVFRCTRESNLHQDARVS